MKILFCNIVVKDSTLNKFGLQGYDAGSLGEKYNCWRGTECIGCVIKRSKMDVI